MFVGLSVKNKKQNHGRLSMPVTVNAVFQGLCFMSWFEKAAQLQDEVGLSIHMRSITFPHSFNLSVGP